MTTYTLFLYHVNPYESNNFTLTEAKICKKLAIFFDKITLNLWTIEEAAAIKKILDDYNELNRPKPFDQQLQSDGPKTYTELDISHEDQKLGFQFLADMINRTFFLLIVLAEVVAFSLTIIPTVGSQSEEGRMGIIKGLEESFSSDPNNGFQMTNDFQSFVPYGK